MNESGLHLKKQKTKRLAGMHKAAVTKGHIPPAAALALAFTGGVLTCFTLLCLFAVIMERSSLPLSAARPMGLAASGVGVAVSAVIAGGIAKKKHMLCGIACGVFCLLCIAAATMICDGHIAFDNAAIISAVTILLCGAMGGTLSAMRTGNATVR